ncbi:MAG: formate dehydrogenase, partial [Gammaproteobacteria bacterium]|nr:formate dehydrogenase [Gammaproteobacteria bacterium]
MPQTIFLPRDFTASAKGSERIQSTIEAQIKNRQLDVEVVRTGSFGMCWLEPLIT